jgi:PTH1 family peptidyl-tRNA hydrolase
VKLIAGLGNPGKQYATSRHNIGFLVINCLAKANGIELKGRKFKSRLGKGEVEGQSVILAKPQTFMNLSGEAVSAIAQYYKIIPQDIIIVHDDLDIPFGSLKIKTKGGSGGHHGLDSIIALLHDDRFLRVRIGIGKPLDERDEADFVLSPFNDSEAVQLERLLDKVNTCLGMLITHDPEFAMNRFHRKEDAKE